MEKLTFKQVKQPDPPRWREPTGHYEIFIGEYQNFEVTWNGFRIMITYGLGDAIHAANDHKELLESIEQAIVNGAALPPDEPKATRMHKHLPTDAQRAEHLRRWGIVPRPRRGITFEELREKMDRKGLPPGRYLP